MNNRTFEKTILRNSIYEKDGKRIILEAKSRELPKYPGQAFLWANCLYIRFLKSDFPNLKYPELKNNHFDYYNCDMAELPWHGGITFYEENIYPENRAIIVVAGCDYQHLYDDHYMSRDCGEEILLQDSGLIVNEFWDIVTKRNEGIKNERV